MPFTLAGDVSMFYCYAIRIYNEIFPTKEQAFGFLANCLLYVVFVWVFGFRVFFFPFLLFLLGFI